MLFNFQINTHAVISTPYSETGRYSVEPKFEFKKIATVEIPLTITGKSCGDYYTDDSHQSGKK